MRASRARARKKNYESFAHTMLLLQTITCVTSQSNFDFEQVNTFRRPNNLPPPRRATATTAHIARRYSASRANVVPKTTSNSNTALAAIVTAFLCASALMLFLISFEQHSVLGRIATIAIYGAQLMVSPMNWLYTDALSPPKWLSAAIEFGSKILCEQSKQSVD